MTIDQRIEQLRAEWKSTPARRASIELQVRVLKAGKNAKPFVSQPSQNSFADDVRSALLD